LIPRIASLPALLPRRCLRQMGPRAQGLAPPVANVPSVYASNQSLLGTRLMRRKGKKLQEYMAKLVRDPAYQKYRMISSQLRRNVAKRFSMAKARFLEKLTKHKTYTLNSGKVLTLSCGDNIKAQLCSHLHAWLCDGVCNMSLDELDRGCFINHTLLLHSYRKVAPLNSSERITAGSVLLTWQGNWGTCSLFDAGLLRTAALEVVIAKVTALDWVQDLWKEFKNQMKIWADAYTLPEWGLSAELCTRTLTTHAVVRIHLHAWVMLTQRKALSMLHLKDFTFRESLPHNSSFLIQHNRGTGQKFAGCFYVTVPKIGSLFSASTKEMFEDFCVSPAWVTSLLAAGKLELNTAADLYVKCVANVDHNLKAVETLKQYRRVKDISAQRLRMEHLIRETQRPFRKIKEVEEWDAQYLELQDRYKFLVLDGKSRTGKSRFAASRTSPEKFLNVDCSSATEPDLRVFDREKHDVVLFDEATPELVLRVKKLAQASIDEVRLGQSATNINSYVVWFHRVKLIVATNVWSASLKRCSPEDQEWLKANSFYVWVDAPLHL